MDQNDNVVVEEDKLKWIVFAMSKVQEVNFMEVTTTISGYTLFLSTVWGSLTVREKRSLKMDSITWSLAAINLHENRGQRTPIKSLAFVWSSMNEHEKTKWNEAYSQLEVKPKLPRWGMEPVLHLTESIEKIASQLRISYRYYFKDLIRLLHVQLKKPTASNGYCNRILTIVKTGENGPKLQKVKRFKMLCVHWPLESTLFNIYWAPRLEPFQVLKTSTITYFLIENPNCIDELFTYHGRNASMFAKGNYISQIGVKAIFDNTYGYVKEMNNGTLTIQKGDMIIKKLRSEVVIRPIIIKFKFKKNSIEIICPRVTYYDGAIVDGKTS